jgi:hypothetical protein
MWGAISRFQRFSKEESVKDREAIADRLTEMRREMEQKHGLTKEEMVKVAVMISW